MRKKIITTLLMTVLAASMLAGCGGSDIDNNTPATEADANTDAGSETDGSSGETGIDDTATGTESSDIDSTEDTAAAEAEHQAYVDEVLAAYEKYAADNELFGVGVAEIGTEGKIYLWHWKGFYKYENGEVVRAFENDFFGLVEDYEQFKECRISEDKKTILLKVGDSQYLRYYIMDADTLEVKDIIHDRCNYEQGPDEIWYESNPDEKWPQEEIVNHPMIVEIENNDFPKRIYRAGKINDVYQAYEASQSNAGVTW